MPDTFKINNDKNKDIFKKKILFLNQYSFLLFILIIVLISGFSLKSFAQIDDEIEIIESIPLETSLEKSDLPRTYDVWLKMINDAKHSIDIETFYFANKKGQPLDDIISAIKIAAEVRSVKVRIIVDSGFYSNNDKSADELEGIQNIEIKKIPFSNLAGGVMHAISRKSEYGLESINTYS